MCLYVLGLCTVSFINLLETPFVSVLQMKYYMHSLPPSPDKFCIWSVISPPRCPYWAVPVTKVMNPCSYLLFQSTQPVPSLWYIPFSIQFQPLEQTQGLGRESQLVLPFCQTLIGSWNHNTEGGQGTCEINLLPFHRRTFKVIPKHCGNLQM